MWCSSYLIFGSCCDGDLWLGQVTCVPFAPIIKKIGGRKSSSSGDTIGTLGGVTP